jgi:CubicO group peptidase (beta-lactamase class C family)
LHRNGTSSEELAGAVASERTGDEDGAACARQAYAGKLFPDRQLKLFRDTGWAFSTRTVARGAKVYPLPRAAQQVIDFPVLTKSGDYDVIDYVSRNRVAGLLILKQGRIALEHYEFGNDEQTRWISMSMAKSISTTLVGVAIRDGYIHSVEDLLVRYLPELAGGGYDGVSIRHLLQMTSGVRWDDTHTDPASERRQMLEMQIAQQPGAILRYVAKQPRVAAPGTVWNYSTGETHVVGALVRAAVGRWVSDYLSEKIWSRFGMESDAAWWLEAPQGLEVAGSGISATLRDYGRFGQFIMTGGMIGSQSVLPDGWVKEATAPRQVGGKQLDYGYMWWPIAARDGAFDDGAFSARGIFGQYVYINPREQVVIVVLSARSKPKGAEAIADNDFFNSAVEALR